MSNHNNMSNRKLLRPSLLAGAMAMALAGGSVQAMDFSRGELSINLDTTISYSAGMRVSDRDDNLVAKSHFNPLVGTLPLEQQIASPGRFSANSDDGNLNFDQWDLIFNQARIVSELQMSYRNYGAFVRANYFYDFTLEDKDQISSAAKDKVGERARLLDAYVWGNFDVADRVLSLRLGRQVINWGESTFLPGGLSSLSPVDVTALRTAGAELREAFLPLNMLWSSIDLTQDLAVEAFLMFEWDRVEPEAVGSFFSTNDFAGDGGRFAMLGFGLSPQPLRNTDLYDDVCVSGNFANTDLNLPPPLVAQGCSTALPRTRDNQPRDGGQWGVALRYFAPWLNDTEFGFYYANYHSRVPLVSGRTVTSPDLTSGAVFLEYPEDIDVFAASFNTNIAGWSLSGELSYRPDLPLQIDDVELLFAGLSPLNAVIPEPALRFRSQLGNFGPGEVVTGYLERDVSQIQATVTRLFGPGNFLRASQMAFVVEAGATHVWNMPSRDVLRLEGPGTDTGGGPSQQTGGDLRNPVTTSDGFATAFSWGYRALLVPTYNNLIGPWNVSPRIAFNHDVTGTTPGPGGNFIAGRKQVTLGVGFDYLAQWRADLSYTKFFGAGQNNLLGDRDFVAATVSYSF